MTLEMLKRTLAEASQVFILTDENQLVAVAVRLDEPRNYGIGDVILGGLSDTPVTIAELFEEVKGDLPQGFTKSKVQYAITRL